MGRDWVEIRLALRLGFGLELRSRVELRLELKFILRLTSHFLLRRTSYFLLLTSYYSLLTSYFVLCISYSLSFLPPSSCFLLPTCYSLLATAYFLLPTVVRRLTKIPISVLILAAMATAALLRTFTAYCRPSCSQWNPTHVNVGIASMEGSDPTARVRIPVGGFGSHC